MTTITQLFQQAFDKAEQETADMFGGQACSMTDKFGQDTCPICFFRLRVKEHLGLSINYGNPDDHDGVAPTL